MTSSVVIQKKNEVYLKIECEPHVQYELADEFTFEVPQAKFMSAYKKRFWDGKIKLFSPGTGEIYAGLLPYITHFCQERGYEYAFRDNEYYGLPQEVDEFVTPEAVGEFVKSLNLPHKVRDYQYKAIYEAMRNRRKLLLSPTASGKSLMIYSLVRFFEKKDLKTLLVVPTTSLVEQMYKDFEEYGWNAKHHCHKVYGGESPISKKDVVITTWQSVYKLPKSYFNDFGAVIGDEAHLFKAKSLTNIMNKLHDCKYRIGFTGTLDGTQTNQLVLEGVFGAVNRVTKTEKLIKAGHLSEFEIKILLLKHDKQQFAGYQDEMEYLVEHEQRNRFIRNLVCDLEGNTLVLFNYVEKHGMPLFDLINNKVGDHRNVFLVYGGVDTEDREKARSIAEKTKDSIIVASYGTFSTGINIRNLHNVVFASPSKSRIRNLQSIGRVLRKGENKRKAVLYDIADDISSGGRRNYTLNHLIERVKVYNEESFNYEFIDVNLRNK
jgi:superfamily II DNA or RNA helicase|tara:strand:- start:338 stop:1810 length:1473 start_codon:yes stop_codon:yes gene_type:complete